MQPPTALLGGRYRFTAKIEAGTKAPTWLARDEQTNQEVVASVLGAARVAALMGVVGLRHPNLAAIVEVVDQPEPDAVPGGTTAGAVVVVAEHLGGKSLHQHIKAQGLTAAESVTLWIRLCRGVAALHASGGAHGAISPRSIVLEPGGQRPAPALTQLLAPTSGAYCAPERLQGRGPSSADDTWALHATLFAALTRHPPFRGDTKDQLLASIASGQIQKLTELGVHDVALEELLAAGLAANLSRRHQTVDQLIEALERWSPASRRGETDTSSEWEDDPRTVVASNEAAVQAMMRKSDPGELKHSLPPVPLGDHDDEDSTLDQEPEPVGAVPVLGGGDDEEATTVMERPDDAHMREILAQRYPQPEPPRLTPTTTDSFPIGGMGPPLPPAPAPQAFPPAAFPAQGHAAFPPPASQAFPPSIPGAPPTGIPLGPGGMPALDDVEIRAASKRPILVLLGIVVLLALGIAVLMFLNYRGVIT